MDFETEDMLAHDMATGRMAPAELDMAYDNAAKHHKAVFRAWLDDGGIEAMAEEHDADRY